VRHNTPPTRSWGLSSEGVSKYHYEGGGVKLPILILLAIPVILTIILVVMYFSAISTYGEECASWKGLVFTYGKGGSRVVINFGILLIVYGIFLFFIFIVLVTSVKSIDIDPERIVIKLIGKQHVFRRQESPRVYVEKASVITGLYVAEGVSIEFVSDNKRVKISLSTKEAKKLLEYLKRVMEYRA